MKTRTSARLATKQTSTRTTIELPLPTRTKNVRARVASTIQERLTAKSRPPPPVTTPAKRVVHQILISAKAAQGIEA